MYMYVAVTNIKGTGLRSGERKCVGELDQNARYVCTHFSNDNKAKAMQYLQFNI